MGNLLACGVPVRVTAEALKPCSESSVARLVLADGTIQELETPVTVAELMLDHPSHFVCHVDQDNVNSGNFDRDHPLPADVSLECGEIYYLRLKAGFGSSSKSPLRQLKRSCSDTTDRKVGLLFRMKQRPGGVTQVTISPEFIAELLCKDSQEQVSAASEDVCEDDHGNAELQMAYQMRLVSRSVSWRPKLATIQESSG